jgi:hypothetical protein
MAAAAGTAPDAGVPQSEATPADAPPASAAAFDIPVLQSFAPRLDERVRDRIAQLWDVMASGADFWSVVYPAFKARELTRTELAALIDRGLRETRGSYTALLKMFNMPPTDYKKFHAFLYQQQCNLPVTQYRQRRPRRSRSAGAQQVA